MQRVYFVGICGTFMGSLALIARELGLEVRGCDANVYPPMSHQLAEQGVEVDSGYCIEHLAWRPDLLVIGNALSRGNPLIEAILDRNLRYTSGPAWLREQVLQGRHVLAIAGTHGKTTTSSMLAWILRDNGIDTGYLIGGLSAGLGVSGRLGSAPYFVVEADEYDSAFFDKRSKFVHYAARTLVINNIEFDHADIFDDLAAIQRQFHHLVRTVPSTGLIVHPANDPVVDAVLQQGCWTATQAFAVKNAPTAYWKAQLLDDNGAQFVLHWPGGAGECSEQLKSWQHRGVHNVANAVAAIAAAAHIGVVVEDSLRALQSFAGVHRRLERLGVAAGVEVYDDFAHHPTAIAAAIDTLRREPRAGRLVAVIEPRSNSMRLGIHRDSLPQAVDGADLVYWYQPEQADWGIEAIAAATSPPSIVISRTDLLIDELLAQLREGDCVLVMSNGGFEGLHHRLLEALATAANA